MAAGANPRIQKRVTQAFNAAHHAAIGMSLGFFANVTAVQ